MDRLQIIQKLFAAYPSTTASPATYAVYTELLGDIPGDELNAVVNQCLMDGGNFPPTIASLRERWRNMHSPTSPDKAADGWLAVQRAMRDPASYSPTPEGPPPKFSDPLVQKAVEALGWHNLRLSENVMADRAQFVRFYQMFAGNEAGEQRLSTEYRQLRDTHQENGNGLVRIGDVLKLTRDEN